MLQLFFFIKENNLKRSEFLFKGSIVSKIIIMGRSC